MVKKTEESYSASSFNSWKAVVSLLDRMGYNTFEAEAILCSKWTRWCRDQFGEGCGKPNTSGCLKKYLEKMGYFPQSKEVNSLVLEHFPEYVVNEQGIPCKKCRSACDGVELLVPLGTPACCDPSQEVYWTM
jgi:hypothetical protein